MSSVCGYRYHYCFDRSGVSGFLKVTVEVTVKFITARTKTIVCTESVMKPGVRQTTVNVATIVYDRVFALPAGFLDLLT